MEVKIKKNKKTKKYQVINSWSEVTLKKWLELISFQEGGKSIEALNTIQALSNIPKKLVTELSINDVAAIMSRIGHLQEKQDTNLKKIIILEGKEYGFHPDLSRITLGEYADIETFIKLGLEKHLPEMMSILYRPVVNKKNKVYTIKKYDGDIDIRTELMKKMKAEDVQSSLVFFWSFVKELFLILPSYLMLEVGKTKMQSLRKDLQVSGPGSE